LEIEKLDIVGARCNHEPNKCSLCSTKPNGMAYVKTELLLLTMAVPSNPTHWH